MRHLLCAALLLMPWWGCSLAVDAQSVSEGCPEGFKECGNSCVPLDDKDFGCASSGCSPCALSNATARCSPEGVCAVAACVGAYEDCDQDPINGCEKNTDQDVENCSGCGEICEVPEHGEAACGNAACYVLSCEQPYGDCNLDFDDGCEVDFRSSADHCGACGIECEVSCVDGVCEP